MTQFPSLSIEEVKEYLPFLTNIQYIDKGGQKIVFKVSTQDEEFVIKFCYIGEIYDEETGININSNLERIKREIKILKEINSLFLPKTSIIEPGKFQKNSNLFFYYSEEFISGYNLRNKIIKDLEIIRVAEHIIKAIRKLWETNKTIHRDIKPANIMFDSKNDCYKLLDLGLAFSSSMPSLTQSGFILGTLPYMSPEQIKGYRNKLDFRSDLFSLGVVLYELITGCHPFFKNNMSHIQIERAIMYEDPINLQDFEIDLPIEFLKFIHTLINKYPHRRFRSFDKMLDILSLIKEG